MIVSFISTQTDFELVLGGNPNGGNVDKLFRVAAGLFTWLNPSSSNTAFDQGSCVGYGQLMLDELSEPIFEVVRVMAVVSVLLGITMLVWIMLISTLSMQNREIWAMNLVFFILTTTVGLSFLIYQSSLCQDGVGDRQDTSCALDEGGLVAIAAIILWFVGLLISCIFIKAPGRDLVLVDGELRSEFGERQVERKRQVEIRALQKERKEEARALEQQRRDSESLAQVQGKSRRERQVSAAAARQTPAGNQETTNTQVAGGEGETEVYLSRALDNIEKSLFCGKEDQSSRSTF